MPTLKLPEHPCPGKWAWWASTDGGETATIGPCDTREMLIAEVVDSGEAEVEISEGVFAHVFMIYEGLENNIDLSRWFDIDNFLDQVADNLDDNDCGCDAYGDNNPLRALSKEHSNDLEKSIKDAIREWQKRHQLPLRAWFFKDTRNEEDLSIPKDPFQ